MVTTNNALAGDHIYIDVSVEGTYSVSRGAMSG